TLRARWTLSASIPFRALCARGSGRASCARRASLTLWSGWAWGSLRTLRARWAGRSLPRHQAPVGIHIRSGIAGIRGCDRDVAGPVEADNVVNHVRRAVVEGIAKVEADPVFTCRTCRTSVALRSLRTSRSHRPSCSSCANGSNWARRTSLTLWSGRALRPLCTLRSCRSLWSGRSLLSGAAQRELQLGTITGQQTFFRIERKISV